MKNILTLSLLLLLWISESEAKTKIFPEVEQVVSAIDLTPVEIQGLIEGMPSNIAIEFKEGNAIPLRFLFNYRIFSMKCDPNLSIKIHSTTYLRSIGRKLYMSTDLVNWNKAKDFFQGRWVPNVKISPDRSHVLVESSLVSNDESDEESVF